MAKYLRLVKPTPKLWAALAGGLLAVVAIVVAEWADLAEVRSTAAGLLVLALSAVGGWLKGDASSPGTNETMDAETVLEAGR